MASALVGALRVVLSADTAEFKTGLGEAGKVTQQFTGQLTGVTSQISSFGKAFGAMFTVGAITAAASKVIDYASRIQDLASQTGLTTDSIEQMAFAAQQTGSSLESFTNAAFKLGTNLSDGTTKVVSATEALGLSYEALRQMSPDEQFATIADALGKVENEQRRNELGVVLMGKAYKSVAAAISEGYAELARQAGLTGKEQIDNLANAGDELDKFKSKLIVLGTFIGGSFAKQLTNLGVALKQDFEFIKTHTVDRLLQSFEDWGTIFGKAAEAPKVLGAAMKTLPPPIGAVTLSLEEQEKAAKSLDTQVAASIETNKASAEAAKAFAAALRSIGGADAVAGAKDVLKQLEAIGGPLKVLPTELKRLQQSLQEGATAARLMGDVKLAESFERAAKELEPISVFQKRFNVTIGEYVPIANAAADATEDMFEQLHRLSGQVQTVGPLLKSSMILPWTQFKDAVKADGPAAVKSFDNIKAAVQDLGNTILHAFQGGGDVLKSIGASLGTGMAKDFVKNFGSKITGALGDTIGGAVNAVLPGIGALLGPALEKLAGGLKKVFGIGINEEVRKANVEIDKLRSNLISTHGPMDQLEAKANIVGLSFARNWAHQGKAGLEAFKNLITEFDKRWADLDAKREKLNGELQKTQGELDGLIGKARDMGYEFDQSGQFIGVTFDSVKAKANEFGVSLDGLGPKFRQQGIDGEAGKIINAFDLMSRAGGDVGGILSGMKDEIGVLVGKSIAMGTTIPKNMEPWIKELIRTDQLTDENGNKITDLTLIKFGEPVATEFETINLELKNTVEKLDDILYRISQIPTERTLTVRAVYEDPGPPDGFGDPGRGGPRSSGPGTAVGTMGRFGSWFHDWGIESLNPMHGIEAVIRPDQAVPFAMDVLGSLGSQAAPAGGGDMSALLSEISGLRRDMLTTIPAIAETAARHGSQTAGRRR